jgi:hypothetical protein
MAVCFRFANQRPLTRFVYGDLRRSINALDSIIGLLASCRHCFDRAVRWGHFPSREATRMPECTLPSLLPVNCRVLYHGLWYISGVMQDEQLRSVADIGGRGWLGQRRASTNS